MDLEELRPELSILRNATDELRASTKFKTVLQIVLAVGNTLNAATFRGNAQGFQLEALLKVCHRAGHRRNAPAETWLARSSRIREQQ